MKKQIASVLCALLILTTGCGTESTIPVQETEPTLAAGTQSTPTNTKQTGRTEKEEQAVKPDHSATQEDCESTADVPEQIEPRTASEQSKPTAQPYAPEAPQKESNAVPIQSEAAKTPSAPQETKSEPPEEDPAPTELVDAVPVEEAPPPVALDIDSIRLDCIGMGQSMGYTLNLSLNTGNASWWNPVTVSSFSQGDQLHSQLQQYIFFHTVDNLSAYGMDEIQEFNICCEARGDGNYAIYFVFA